MVQVRIAMVGKYTGLTDSYLSVLKVTLSIVYLNKPNIELCISL